MRDTTGAGYRIRSGRKQRRRRGSREQQTTRYQRPSPHFRQHYARTRLHVTAPHTIAEPSKPLLAPDAAGPSLPLRQRAHLTDATKMRA